MDDEHNDITITSDDENPAAEAGHLHKGSFGNARPDSDDIINVEDRETDSIAKLKDKLHVCLGERQEYLTGWQRSKADFVNARKEEEKHRAEFVAFSKEGVLSELLPVLDSFELAMANKASWESVDATWRKGVEYIYQQLKSVLEAHGLTALYPVGQKFDPNQHDAIEKVKTERQEDDGTVTEVLQSGYALNGRIVRHSKVKVGYLE